MDQRANRCGFQVEDQWGHCLGAPMSCLCSGNCFRRELPAGVVDGVGRIEDQLTDGHNGIPVVDQAVEDGRQGLRRVQRSVVEQHDAPRLHLGCYAPAYRIRVVVLPVQGVHIPLDRFHTHGAYGGDDVVVILPVGTTDQRGGHAGNSTDPLVAGGDIVNDLLSGQTVVMVVVIGVAHHLVARVVQGFDGLRVLLRPISHNKEGGLDTIPRQNVDKRLGVLVAPR